jgi:hypothetical protein
MDQIETSTHSFIIRIWREENDRPSWRGYITHVPSGEQQYLPDLGDIITFIIPYLQDMGISVTKKGT